MGNGEEKNEACLVCGSKKGRMNRGLCTAHYMQFRKHLKQLTPEGKIKFENKLVSEGKLLPPQPGRRSKVVDPFAETVQRLVAENPDFVKSSIPFDANKNDATIEKHYKGKKPKQK